MVTRMANNQQRRLRLFDIYSKNLCHYLDGAPEGYFICPICKKDFPRKAVLDGPELAVDLAHCYPESCGGKLETLTCKKCSSRMGTLYDSQLALERKVHRVMDPSSDEKLKGRLRFTGGEIGVEFSKIGDTLHFSMIRKQSNPKEFQALIDGLIGAKAYGFEFTFLAPRFQNHKAALGLWHSAFLMMFREFGYEFAFSPAGETMRELLLRTEPPDIALPIINIPVGQADPTILNRVGIMTHPPECRSLFAVMPTPDKQFLGRFVVIPGVGRDWEKGFEAITHRQNGAGTIRFNGRTIGGQPLTHLQTFAYRQYLQSCWEDVSEDSMILIETTLAIQWLARGSTSNPVAVSAVAERLGLEFNLGVELVRWQIENGMARGCNDDLATATVCLTENGKKCGDSMLNPAGKMALYGR